MCSKDLELNSDGVLFQVPNIYGTHAVGFPLAKSHQQPQDLKPQIDGMEFIKRQNKHYDSCIHYIVCNRGFVPKNMPPVCCYEDVNAQAGVIVRASTWTPAFLAFPS